MDQQRKEQKHCCLNKCLAIPSFPSSSLPLSVFPPSFPPLLSLSPSQQAEEEERKTLKQETISTPYNFVKLFARDKAMHLIEQPNPNLKHPSFPPSLPPCLGCIRRERSPFL
jgi:hypothetical protein